MKNITLSGFVLILSNIVPFIGVLHFDWEPMDVIFIYWLETLFIGLFNIIKMIFVSEKYIIWKFILIPFFIFVFVLLQGIQGLIVFNVFPHYIHRFTDQYFEITILSYLEYLFWPSLALLLSHLFSLIWNFFLRKEYKKLDMTTLIVQPLPRIFFLFCVAYFGILVLVISENTLFLMVLVVLAKIYFDLKAHLKSHKSIQEVEPGSA